jgi:hypothetical protein
VRAATLTRPRETIQGGELWHWDLAEIREEGVYRVQVRAGGAAAVVAWAAKDLDQAGNAFVPSVGSGPLISGVSHATTRCAPSAIHR